MTRWALVGRNAELSRALEVISVPTTDRGNVLFAGPQGAGKTRLLQEAVDSLDERTLVVQIFGEQALSTTPFAGWRWFRPPPSLRLDEAEVMRHIAARMAHEAAGRPIVVAVDDLHLLDELSTLLLHQFVVTGTVKLLGTLRTDAPPPPFVPKITASDLVEHVRVEPLTFEATWDLLVQVLGGPVEERSARRVWELTSGKPLTIRQILGGDGAGLFTQEFGLWRLPADAVLPAGSDFDLAASRVDGLAGDVQDTLGLVLLGEPIGLHTLVKLTSEAAVETAEVEGFVRVVRDGRRLAVRVAHPLYREVIRHRLTSQLRRTRLLRDLASVVRATGMRRSEDVLRVGTWLLDAGGPADAELLLAAANSAYASFDHELAARLAEAALQEGAGLPAATLAALVYGFNGQGRRALDLLEQHREGLSTPAEHAGWALVRSMITFNAMGCIGSPKTLRETTARVGHDLEGLATVLGAAMDAFRGDYDGAYARLLAVEDDANAMPAARHFATAVAVALDVQRGLGDPAVEVMADVLARAPRYWSVAPLARTGVEYGRWTTALVTGNVDRLISRSVDEPEGFMLLDVVTALSMAASRRLHGGVRAGQTAALEAVILARRSGQVFHAVSLAELAACSALLGEWERAAADIAQARRLERPVSTIMYPWLDLPQAQVRASAGDLDAARHTLAGLLTRLRRDGFAGVEVLALHAFARFGLVDEEVLRGAQSVCEAVPGAYPTAVLQHVRGLRHGDATALAAAAAGYRELGLSLYEAEALNQRQRLTGSADRRLATLLRQIDGRQTPALR